MASADQLGVEDVLTVVQTLFALDGEVHKNEYKILCPVHADHKPSCDVNLRTGYWNCWSCKGSGDLVELGHVVTKRPRKEIKKLLRPNEPEAILVAIQSRVRARRRAFDAEQRGTTPWRPHVPPEGSYSDGPMKSLLERGFRKSTLRKWGIRYVVRETLEREDDDPFEITHAIAIPIFSPDGDVLAWCYRATERSKAWFRNIRYIYTPGVNDILNQTWFGLHLHANERNIVICEGALDAMWLDQNGIPALAVLGSHAKQDVKIRLLMDFRKVTILTDRDRAGVDAATSLGEALQSRGIPTTVCRYSPWMLNTNGKPAKDPQELGPLDLELVLERQVPFHAWRMRRAS